MARVVAGGFAIAILAAVLAFTGDALSLETTWPLLVGAAVALVPAGGLPGRLSGFASGLVAAWIAFALRAAVLPDVAIGRALYAVTPIVIVLAVAVVSRGRAPLWAGLIGAATFIGAYEAVFVAAPTDFVIRSMATMTSLLLATALGALVSVGFRAPAPRRAPADVAEPAPAQDVVKEPSGRRTIVLDRAPREVTS